MKKYAIFAFLGLLILVLIACNLITQFAAPTETAEDPALNFPTTTYNEIPSQVQETTIPTANPLSSAQDCLNGTWSINNLSSYVTKAIPPELTEQYNLKYKDTVGSATVSFSPDGRITLRFDGLIFRFDASVSILTVPLTVGVDGEARGEYVLNGDLLTTSQMDTSGITAAAEAMGQNVVEPAQIISLIPLVQPPFNTAVYTCAGDTLQLEFPAYPEDFPPLVFQRVK